MEAVLANKVFFKLCFTIIIVLLKVLYVTIIYSKCNSEDVTERKILTALSVPFPIIIGIICIVKNKNNAKNVIIILVSLVFYLVSGIAAICGYSYLNAVKYYDKDGTAHIYASDVVFTDAQENKYSFDFEKTGYDYLYINSTDERLNSDWCYLDSEGYLYYDDDMSITVNDENLCVDDDGSLYYPVQYTTFNKDGTINYCYFKQNFRYDRLANAYTYDYVPYYDIDGNKYFYSFDSVTQKGSYTNIETGEAFDNEYSFVDENGYLVCDKEHSFTQQKDVTNVRTYTDSAGETYYWASGVFWDENGNLLDSSGEIIK